VKKYLMHPIYWIRYGLSCPVMWLGYLFHDMGTKLLVMGNRTMDTGVAIEGNVPDGAW
jgi:hypothetical protein